jgi:multiple sugar transport system substrate-binding protein
MSDFTRRDVLKAGVAAGAVAATSGLVLPASAQELKIEPEKGATLRVLRWKQFVQGDIDLWTKNTKKFEEKTGIKVRVDTESWEDVRPKAAVAANVNSGPDIIIGTLDDPHKFPDKLVDLTDLANYLDKKYGGWFDTAKRFGMREGRWIALPQGCPGSNVNYRESQVQAAGFEKVPDDLDGFLKLMKALKAKGTPGGFALGHATGDANNFAHWLVWAFGGKMVDKDNNVVINSPETIQALEYAKELYETFVPGTLTWQDPSNNKAYLSGELSLTANGISIWYAGKNSPDPKQQEIAKDTQHTKMPKGKDGKYAVQNLVLQAFVFKYSKYPKAAQEYLRWMWEAEQYEPWQTAMLGYVSPPLKKYLDTPVWTSDPKITPFRDAMDATRDNGYAGSLGFASAAVIGDFVMVDMVAKAASGAASPKEAAAEAQSRAERYYKV